MRPLATYWPRRPTSTTRLVLQLAPAFAVLAVFPDHPLAVLDDVLGDERHDVLAVVVEGDLADDRVLVLNLGELGDHALAVRADLLDGVHQQRRRGERERSIRFRSLLVLRLGVLAGEVEAAGQLLPGRAFD